MHHRHWRKHHHRHHKFHRPQRNNPQNNYIGLVITLIIVGVIVFILISSSSQDNYSDQQKDTNMTGDNRISTDQIKTWESSEFDYDSEEALQKAFDDLNKIRNENNVPNLIWNEEIYQLVKFQASKNPCSQYSCSHMDSEGKYFDYYAPDFGVSLYGGSGENIAGSSCYKAVSDLWLHSTMGHREIMLDPKMHYGALAYYNGDCVLIVTG
jgi:uncharacterized protein YkwD